MHQSHWPFFQFLTSAKASSLPEVFAHIIYHIPSLLDWLISGHLSGSSWSSGLQRKLPGLLTKWGPSMLSHALTLHNCDWIIILIAVCCQFPWLYTSRGSELLRLSLQNIASVQFSSITQSCPTLCDPMDRSVPASLSITNSRSLPKLMSNELVMPSNHLILCQPLLLSSIFPSIKVFSNESALHIRWPKYWSFNFNISPTSEHPRLISFRMDWLDLLAVQGILKSLLQHHSTKA